jgi:uncharacterized protein DUF6328
VAGLGVQMIFGFLLSLPFTNRFSALGPAQRGLYVVTLLLAAVATALLLGPVAYHRLVFRRHLKRHLVTAANRMAILGLAAVGLTMSAAVLLVLGYVARGLPATFIAIRPARRVLRRSRRRGNPRHPPSAWPPQSVGAGL